MHLSRKYFFREKHYLLEKNIAALHTKEQGEHIHTCIHTYTNTHSECRMYVMNPYEIHYQIQIMGR